MTLYEMTQQTKELYEILQNEEIEQEEKEQILSDMLESFGADEKVEAYCQVIRQLEAENNGLTAEVERLEKALSRNEKGVKRLKSALAMFIESTGEKKVKGGTFEVSLKRSEKTIIDDLEKIPEQFLRTKTTVEADKKLIKESINNGMQVEGAHIEKSVSAQIK